MANSTVENDLDGKKADYSASTGGGAQLVSSNDEPRAASESMAQEPSANSIERQDVAPANKSTVKSKPDIGPQSSISSNPSGSIATSPSHLEMPPNPPLPPSFIGAKSIQGGTDPGRGKYNLLHKQPYEESRPQPKTIGPKSSSSSNPSDPISTTHSHLEMPPNPNPPLPPSFVGAKSIQGGTDPGRGKYNLLHKQPHEESKSNPTAQSKPALPLKSVDSTLPLRHPEIVNICSPPLPPAFLESELEDRSSPVGSFHPTPFNYQGGGGGERVVSKFVVSKESLKKGPDAKLQNASEMEGLTRNSHPFELVPPSNPPVPTELLEDEYLKKKISTINERSQIDQNSTNKTLPPLPEPRASINTTNEASTSLGDQLEDNSMIPDLVHDETITVSDPEVPNSANATMLSETNSVMGFSTERIIPTAFLVEDTPAPIHAEAVVISENASLDQRNIWGEKKKIGSAACLMIVCVVVAVVIAISITSNNGGNDSNGNQQMPTNSSFFMLTTSEPSTSPSTSTFPSIRPSSSPTMTQSPSSSPTTCLSTISEQELLSAFFQSSLPKAKLTGDTAIVNTGREKLLIYSLTNDQWTESASFDVIDPFYDGIAVSDDFVLASSKKEVFSGISDSVRTYTLQGFGDSINWQYNFLDAFPQGGLGTSTRFGTSIDIFKNTMVVGAPRDRDSTGSVYVFKWKKRGSTKRWVQQSKLAPTDIPENSRFGYSVQINANMIAVLSEYLHTIHLYAFDANLQNWLPLKETLNPRNSTWVNFRMSENTIAVGSPAYESGIDQGRVYIYTQSEERGPFSLVQTITPPDGLQLASFGVGVDIDRDILIVGAEARLNSIGRVYIFTLSDGYWEEALTLTRQGHDSDLFGRNVAVYGRRLLVGSGSGVYAYNLNDCTQAMPTEQPTSSHSPTLSSQPSTSWPTLSNTARNTYFDAFSIIPSNEDTRFLLPSSNPTTVSPTTSSPTQSPSSSLIPSGLPSESHSPSRSISPTETCFLVRIFIVFDKYPLDTSWSVTQLDVDEAEQGLGIILQSPDYETFAANSTVDHAECLTEGIYLFEIYDKFGDGICCAEGDGIYWLDVEGEVIIVGGEFEFSEKNIFSIPISSPPN